MSELEKMKEMLEDWPETFKERPELKSLLAQAIAELEKECEWQKNDSGHIDEYLTGCFQGFRVGHLDIQRSGYVFCPYCGRKIKEVKQ